MGVATVDYLHGILLPDDTLLSELTDCTPGANSNYLTGYASGHDEPLFRSVSGQTPDASFTSCNIKTILDLIIAGGNNYGLDLSAGNTDLLYKRGQDLGVRYAAAAAQHARLRAAQAFLYWNTISASHQQNADIACRLVAAYDGTNVPLVPAGTIALSGTPAATEFYTLGPVKINGAWLTNEQDWSLSSGVTPEEAGAAGEIWNSYVGIKQTDPVLTVNCLGNPWALEALTGTAIATGLLLYLRKKDADGHNVADATEEHIKFSASYGYVLPESTRGAQNDPATTTLRIALRPASSLVETLAIDTTAAIA